MSEDNTVYSTTQLSTALGLGTAMVRKYAIALEKLTGEDIPIKRRDGRQFSTEHLRILSAAKSLVDSNKGLTVDLALKMVLSSPQSTPTALQPVETSSNTLISAETILEAAKDLKAIREQLEALREEVGKRPALQPPPPEIKKSGAANEHGLLVRVAMRLEDLLKRFR